MFNQFFISNTEIRSKWGKKESEYEINVNIFVIINEQKSFIFLKFKQIY